MYQVLELANLSNRQRKYFEVIFQEININPNNPRVPSQIVVPLFKASSLEFLVWKEIWKLSCAQADSLSLLEFIICLKFITLAQNEKKLQHDQLDYTKNLPLPKFSNLKVDPENFNGIKDNGNEQQILIQKHKKFEIELTQNLTNYENLIKKHTQKEVIETLDQNDAKTFYKIFNIHYYAISLIWNLCDINSSDKLEPGAIIVSIHLIKLYLKNIEPPQKLSLFYENFIKNYNKKKIQQQPKEQQFVQRVHKVNPQIQALQDEDDTLLSEEHQKKLGYIQKLITSVDQNTDKLSVMKVSFYDTISRNSLVKRNIQESLLKNLEISRQKLKDQYTLKQKLEVSLKKMKDHLDHDDLSNDNKKLDKKKYEKIIQKLKLYCEQDYNEFFQEIQMENDPTEIEFPQEKLKKSDTILAQENEEDDEEQIIFEGPDFSDTRSNEQIKVPEQPQMNFNKNTNHIVQTQSEIIKIENKKNEFEPDFDFDNFGETDDNNATFETNFDF